MQLILLPSLRTWSRNKALKRPLTFDHRSLCASFPLSRTPPGCRRKELLHLRTCNGELKFSDWMEEGVRRTDAGRRAVVFPVHCAVLPSTPFSLPRFNPARASRYLLLVPPIEEKC